MEDRYTLEVNERQLRLINKAIEEYFRLRINQWDMLADDLAAQYVDFSRNNPNHERIFDEYITKRNCAKCGLESVGKMLWDATGYMPKEKTEEVLIAGDIWHVIKHELWLENHGDDNSWSVDSCPVFKESKEPLPKCSKVDKPKKT